MKKAFTHKIVFGAAALLVLAGTGCVRTAIEPAYNPKVGTSQNSDGEVTISFETKPGYIYKLLVMDPETRQWKQLRNSKTYYGDGKTVTIKDKRNPRKKIPWYSVRAVAR